MSEEQKQALSQEAHHILEKNDRAAWTVPALELYPHQWLWDSCFIAIGLRHINVDRAQTEILSLLRGQWANGMLPHMIFADGDQHRADREIWRSYVSPHAPANLFTSGITQPPMLAEAVVQVGKKLKDADRHIWYSKVYPALVKYHLWLFGERNPHKEGLVVNIHPYECGLDNTPPWIYSLRQHSMPWWVSLIEKLHLSKLVDIFRRDTRYIPPGQRMNDTEALAYFWALRRLRQKAYNTDAILSRSLFAVEDLSFNCIALRANSHLHEIAKALGKELPEELQAINEQAAKALENLWDPETNQYYCRNFVTHKLIKEPSIEALMPLYSGVISQERAAHLVKMLETHQLFGSKFPVPSVPLNSAYYNPMRYWQGPTWLNTNWLIIDGLERYGFKDEAEKIRQACLQVTAQNGMFEYFNPETGEAAGSPGFSWTAALTLDLLLQS